jgi:hypothetical protein
MALGGGVFLTQNKVLPGSYINFVSAAKASANISDRGYVAIPVELDWGIDGQVFTVEAGDIQKESLKIFGYDYTSPKLRDLREVFRNAKTVYCYRLNSGTKAENEFATAKYTGTRGNDIKIIIQTNVEEQKKYDVLTMFGGVQVDAQTVSTAAELIGNDYVDFKAAATLAVTAGANLATGKNAESITGTKYQEFLDKVESYSFNTLGCPSTNSTIIDLFVQYTKRMRDEIGAKFQTVVYRSNADYEGIISVENTVKDEGANAASLVYWVTGTSAGCAVNKSNTNKVYDGEYSINVEYKQSQLEAALKSGKFIFHKVGNNVRVLDDINTFVSVTVEKNSDFNSNQVIRVLDQVANDIAVLFNTRYIGKVQNNEAGRIAFWNDLVTYNQELQTIQAVENVKAEEIVVEKGNDKKSVVVKNPITPVCTMSKLYMTVIVQ